MATLGILEGRFPLSGKSRAPVFLGGTLASSRTRRPVGPSLFGSEATALSTTASQAAGRGRAADAAYAQAKATALSAGVAPALAEAIAVQAGRATSQGQAYDVVSVVQSAVPKAAASGPTQATSQSALMTEDQLRSYYADTPSSASTASDVQAPAAPAPAPQPSAEDVLRATNADAPGAPPAASSTPPAAPTAKSFLVPVAVMVAAWFFLKG